MGQNLLSESAVLEYIRKAVDSDIGKPAASVGHGSPLDWHEPPTQVSVPVQN